MLVVCVAGKKSNGAAGDNDNVELTEVQAAEAVSTEYYLSYIYTSCSAYSMYMHS
jgi:hypothetical protein